MEYKKGDILPDGSVFGETFSGASYTGGYPHIRENESSEEYRKRVDRDFKAKGFHLGDLSWSDWGHYCGEE